MTRWTTLAMLLIACGGDKAEPGDTAGGSTAGATAGGGGGGTPCAPTASDDLADPFAGLADQADACSVSPYWDIANMATTFFVGDFEVDSCGEITGTETWVLYMNQNMKDLGYIDCEVIWDVTGTHTGALEGDNAAIEMNAVVNAGLTTCLPNEDGVEIYVGEEDVTLSYTLILNADGTAETRFSSNGDTIGFGGWNANNITYTSDMSCKAF